MKHYFADLHIHVGRTLSGKPVKITGAKSLTIDNIIDTASEVKGMHLIGIIDCHVPEVIYELEMKTKKEECFEHTEGGIVFENITLLLGSEIEVYDENCKGPIHVLVFLPTIYKMKQFSAWLTSRMTNVHLSSQRIYESGKTLQNVVKKLGGLFIPAHVFTPFKSLYGKGVEASLREVFCPEKIDAIELGLSSNTAMADQVAELHDYSFLSNSDAHSLGKIAREYQKIALERPTFHELRLALQNKEGRKIVCNYGLDPKLGKYYRTTCQMCFAKQMDHSSSCLNCGQNKWVKGVFERLQQLKNTETVVNNRPAYIHQVPLEYFPGIGPKTLEKLRHAFKTEMNILHNTSYEELVTVIPKKIATMIVNARKGNISIMAGGGGKYGKLK